MLPVSAGFKAGKSAFQGTVLRGGKRRQGLDRPGTNVAQMKIYLYWFCNAVQNRRKNRRSSTPFIGRGGDFEKNSGMDEGGEERAGDSCQIAQKPNEVGFTFVLTGKFRWAYGRAHL
jgi:hypothetical protein